MEIVLIYGPPATGKLTVANELSKLTKYTVFHNHLAIELVRPIHKFDTPRFWELVERYRLELIEDAARYNKIKGLILTFVYGNTPGDDRFVKKILKIAKEHRHNVRFVQLYSSRKELLKRLKGKSRYKYTKLKDAKTLTEVLEKYDTLTPINFVKSLRINNSKIPPKKAALLIKEHYEL